MSRHRDAFEGFAEEVVRQLDGSLKELYLFGSVARGEERSGSDVDVFVVVESEGDKELVEELAFDASVEYGVFLVPIVKTMEEFESSKDSIFVDEVRRTGEAYV